MRVGCAPDVSGVNDPAPAEDVLNENPSLVALGKIRPKATPKSTKSRPKSQPKFVQKVNKNQPKVDPKVDKNSSFKNAVKSVQTLINNLKQRKINFGFLKNL